MHGFCKVFLTVRTTPLMAMAVAIIALGQPGCSHLERDIEYSLRPMRPHVASGQQIQVQLVDIGSRRSDDYLVVRLRIENRTDSDVVVSPQALQLVIGDHVKAARDRALARKRSTLELSGRGDDDGDDDDTGSTWTPRSSNKKRPSGSGGYEEEPRGALSALDPGVLGDAAKEGAKKGAQVVGGVVAGVAALGYVAVKGTVLVVKGSALLVKGIHDAIDDGIHDSRHQIEPGGSTEIAIKFDGVASERGLLPSYLPSYIFFDDVLHTDKHTLAVPPLLVTNPQEAHLGYAPPQRSRLAMGLRAGGGTTGSVGDTEPIGGFFGLSGFIGPRVGPWSFTAISTVGNGFMLGFDVRRDLTSSKRFLSTAYLGYGRYWLVSSDPEIDGSVSGRGPRIGVDLLFAFTRQTLDWHVTTGGFGFFLEAAPLWLDEGNGVNVVGGLSFLGF